MISNIYEIDDPEYREFVIEYVRKHYSNVLFTNEEIQLLKPTHHYGPQLKKGEIGIFNPMASKEGCCGVGGDDRLYRKLGLERPCVRKDAVDIEERYNLKEVSQQLPGSVGYRWRCLGWVNLNFRSPRMAKAFLIQCINRVLKENNEVIFSNTCQICNRLKRTPKAIQCMWCL